MVLWQRFQSTLSLRRATRGAQYIAGGVTFQSTLSLRRATITIRSRETDQEISIHALLAESDIQLHFQAGKRHDISIHALLAESDMVRVFPAMSLAYFNPRSPCGERRCGQVGLQLRQISIHALLAESDDRESVVEAIREISIHALLAESDVVDEFQGREAYEFQSTLSLRRATRSCWMPFWPGWHFNPRSPCGERPAWSLRIRFTIQFQSTLSLRRATAIGQPVSPTIKISIHALLAESDRMSVHGSSPTRPFQSTLSLRRATFPINHLAAPVTISIHALLAESDLCDW